MGTDPLVRMVSVGWMLTKCSTNQALEREESKSEEDGMEQSILYNSRGVTPGPILCGPVQLLVTPIQTDQHCT